MTKLTRVPSKYFASAVEDLDARIKTAREMKAVLRSPEVLDMYNRLPSWVRKREQGMPRLNVYDREVSLYITLHDVVSLKKDRKLNSLLEAFADDVYKPTTYTYASGSGATAAPVGDYNFVRYREGFKFRVTVSAYVKSDSEQCKVVVTGVRERVSREEITEVVCK